MIRVNNALRIIIFVCVTGIFLFLLSCDRMDDYLLDEGLDLTNDHLEEEDVYIRIYFGSDMNVNGVDGRQYSIIPSIKKYVEHRFPDLQFIYIQEGQDYKNDLEYGKPVVDEILKGEINYPDIYIDYAHYTPFFLEKELIGVDLNYYADLYNLDLSRFDPAFLDQMMLYGEGTLYALPLARSLHAMMYDKEYFETKGIQLSNRPTWSDVLLWEDDVKYDVIIDHLMIHFQLDTNFKKLIEEEYFEEYVSYIMPFVSNYGFPYSRLHSKEGSIFRTENIAFPSTRHGNIFTFSDDWDLVAYPTFEGSHYGPDYVIDMVAISPHTENMDIVMEIVNALVSDEYQLELSRIGIGSPLSNPVIHQSFGEEIEAFKGKNVAAFFQNKPSSHAIYNTEEIKASRIVLDHLFQIYQESDRERQLKEMIRQIQDLFE